MSRRQQIALTPAEADRYLREQKTIILCSIDHRGYPHAVAMWFEVDPDGSILMTTYAKSQKTRNLERNPKVAVLVESGERYEQLKGVLIRGRAELIHDVDRCAALLMRVHKKMQGEELPAGAEDVLRAQARKRVLIRIVPEHASSWDHAKLGGVY
jgi:PPOX class probable F420-dependent enzyme